MTDGGILVGLYALGLAAAGWVGLKVVEHRRTRTAQHRGTTPAE